MTQPVGRPPWIPTEDDIKSAQTMYGRGMTLEQIADYFGISYDTLNERRKEIPEFRDALKKGKGQAGAYVTGKLFEQIQGNNLTAIIFYLKAQMGWKEAQAIEHTGKDGGAINIDAKSKVEAHDHLKSTIGTILNNKKTDKDDTDNGI